MNQTANLSTEQALAATSLSPLQVLGFPAVATSFLWLTSVNPVSLISVGCSFVMLQLVWFSYLVWRQRTPVGLPIFAIIGSIYWLYFSLGLFWGERILMTRQIIAIQENVVTNTMEMALTGVICIFIGMLVPVSKFTSHRVPDLAWTQNSTWVYVRAVTLGLPLLDFGNYYFFLGSGMRQVMVVLIQVVPAVGFCLLLSRLLKGRGSLGDRNVLLAALVIRVVASLSSGWLAPCFTLGLSGTFLYVTIRKRIPWTPIILTVAAILFLQVGKAAFRGNYWGSMSQGVENADVGIFERLKYWVDASATQWSEALQGGDATKSKELAAVSLQRASLVTQIAHVIDLTPSQIAYQGGETYYYTLVSVVPRFLWPDKPSVTDANRVYQITYGLTDARGALSTSISVGSMAEAYINFGWLGVILVMCLIGALIRFFEQLFTANQSHILFAAIGVALLPQFLTIESQLGQYVGGVLQEILLSIIVFLPVTRTKTISSAPVRYYQKVTVRARG